MRPRERAALILVTIALLFACLAIGGAPRWAACIASGLGLATAIPYLTSRRSASRPALLLLPLAVMALLTALQLVPLPVSIAEMIAPAKVALVNDNARAWAAPEPQWVMASFDPPATLVELAKLVGYLGLAWTCTRLASEKRARPWLFAACAGVAAITALVTLAHLATRTHLVYGVYKTSTTLDFVGPVVSSNHLASLVALATPLAAMLALQTNGMRRGAWFFVAALLVSTTLLSGSRGGVLGLVAGLTVTGAAIFAQRRVGSDGARPVNPAVSMPVAAVAGAAMLVLVLLTAGDVTRDLSRTSLDELNSPESKFQVWERAAHMTADHRWLGVGKGGFEPAFTPLAQSGTTVFSHVENGYLQAVVDWGVPGAAIVFLSLGTAALAGLRRWRKGAIEAGALGAIAALAIHDLADFSIELPAVAMVIIAGSSVLFPDRLATARKDDGHRIQPSVLVLRAGCVAIGAVVVVLASSPLGRTAREDYDRLTLMQLNPQVESARSAHARHPASFLIAGRAAEALFASRDPRALKVIARALAMNSNHGGLRHLAARMLVVSNRPEQAASEFAAAARLSRDVRPIVRDVLAAFREPERIASALPTDRGHAAAIIRVLGDRRDAALAFARRVGQVHPRDAEMQALLAEAALEAGAGADAAAASERAWSLAPVARHAVLLASAREMTGARVQALELITAAEDSTRAEPVVDRVRLLLFAAELHVRAGDAATAKAVLERGRDLASSERRWLALVHLRLGDVEELLGNRNQAAWERRRARELDPPP